MKKIHNNRSFLWKTRISKREIWTGKWKTWKDRWLTRILKKIPDEWTGRRSVFLEKYRICHGNVDCSSYIREEKKNVLWGYIMVLFLFSLLLFFLLADQALGPGREEALCRPKPTESVRSLPVNVELTHEQGTFKQQINLRIAPKNLSRSEKENLLSVCSRELKKSMLNENPDSMHVTTPLFFPRSIGKVEIRWKTDCPKRIKETGELDLLGLKEPLPVQITAEFTLEDVQRTETYALMLQSAGDELSIKKALKSRLLTVMQEVEKDQEGTHLILPEVLPDQVKVSWKIGKRVPFIPLLFLTVLCIFMVFHNRYRKIETELRKNRLAMEQDFPEFISQLVLLLGAGLVVTSAVERIVLEDRNRPLYLGLKEVCNNVKETNASFTGELCAFAKRSGRRELLRFSAIVLDNMDKGSTLAEKLQAEGELLLLNRKRQIEERSKKVETKLTLPLMVLLLVLVMITVAPTLIEM